MLINTVPNDCLMYITSIVNVFMLSIEKKFTYYLFEFEAALCNSSKIV